MKLINLLIRELDNCSLGGVFRVSCHAEICQFDCFSLEINFKRPRSCNYGIPRLVQVKMKILYKNRLPYYRLAIICSLEEELVKLSIEVPRQYF